mmetsp:Transcript_22941/g.38819  ORF Transcript_22941/g.38819 Transcript_22941/m.38819 type:complete len:828 (+) Transcript_22941:138-2621(+)
MLLLIEHLDEKNDFATIKRELYIVKRSDDPVTLVLGRNADSDLCFPLDKSVSKKHCQLIVHPNGALAITDLKSSLGTRIDKIKAAPHEETQLSDKVHIKLGTRDTNFRISKYKFCHTRLEKAEKSRLQVIARAIGGGMMKQLESSTHLICNQYSSTIKVLQAIVRRIPIVSMAFAESLSLLSTQEDTQGLRKVVITTPPNEVEYPPLESESLSTVVDPMTSRETLFAGHIVILLEEDDLLYSSLLTECGAVVLNLAAMPTSASANELVAEVDLQKDQLKAGSGVEIPGQRSCSIFYQENKSARMKTILLSRHSDFNFFTLESVMLSILSNSKPELLPSDTLSQRALSQLQNSVQQYSQQANFSPSNTTLAKASTEKKKGEPPSNRSAVNPRVLALPSTFIDVEHANSKKDSSDVKSSSISNDSVSALPRATTLLPTQESDANERSTGSVNKNDNKVVENNDIVNDPVVRRHTYLKSDGLKQDEQAVSNNVIGSPVQMCDIKIEVDFSDQNVKNEELHDLVPNVETPPMKSPPVQKNERRSRQTSVSLKQEAASPAEENKNDTSHAVNVATTSSTPLEKDIEDKTNRKSTNKKRKKSPMKRERSDDEVEAASPPRTRRKNEEPEDQVLTGGLLSYENEKTVDRHDGESSLGAGEDGWLSTSKRVMTEKSPNKIYSSLHSLPKYEYPSLNDSKPALGHNSNDDDVNDVDGVYPPAVSVEVRLTMRVSSERSNSRDTQVGVRGDKRCFAKNYVRGHFNHSSHHGGARNSLDSQVTISLRQMDKLLPKESEREIQLQKAYEEEQQKLIQRDELFSERPATGKSKGKRKLFG